jgi:hypothetical protein
MIKEKKEFKTDEEIDQLLNEMLINTNRSLNIIIRYAERHKLEQEKKRLCEKKQELNEYSCDENKRNEYKRYEYLINMMLSYEIKIRDTSDFDNGNVGRVLVYEKGAIISYKTGSTPLEADIIIAHELGHILNHIPTWVEQPVQNPEIRKEQEIEATHFAERILKALFNGELSYTIKKLFPEMPNNT